MSIIGLDPTSGPLPAYRRRTACVSSLGIGQGQGRIITMQVQAGVAGARRDSGWLFCPGKEVMRCRAALHPGPPEPSSLAS